MSYVDRLEGARAQRAESAEELAERRIQRLARALKSRPVDIDLEEVDEADPQRHLARYRRDAAADLDQILAEARRADRARERDGEE